MQEHPSSHQLRLYQRRALAPDLFLSVHRHVSACPFCSEQYNTPPVLEQDYETLLAALMPEPGDEPYHMTSAELAGYVAGSLDAIDTESAESHLSVCAQCAEDVKELRARPARGLIAESERAGLLAALWAWRRPALLASLMLLALGLLLTALFVNRSGDDRSAQSVTRQADNVNGGSNQSEAVPEVERRSGDTNANAPGSGDSTTGLPGVGDGARDAGPDIETDASIAALLSPSSRRAITSALKEQRLDAPPVLAQLRGVDGSLRGGTGEGRPFALLNPVGKVVQSASPTFTWKPLAGASSYVVTVADDQLNEAATSGPLTGTQWTPRAPLRRGGVYSWQVTALKDGQAVTSPVTPAPQAKFMVLDQARSEELRRVRAAAPRYHLGLGVLYARAGLLDEAEREFRALVDDNPRSTAAAKLLQSVRSMAR